MDGDKYVAMDLHKASVVIGVRDASGKYIMESIVPTRATMLLDFVKGLSGKIHLTFEKGTHSVWLYDLLKPHVADLLVAIRVATSYSRKGTREMRLMSGNCRIFFRPGCYSRFTTAITAPAR